MPGIAASIHWRPSPCPWPNQSCKRWHRANMYEMGRLHALALDAFHREIACKIRRKLRRETLHVDEKEEDIARKDIAGTVHDDPSKLQLCVKFKACDVLSVSCNRKLRCEVLESLIEKLNVR
ncbi:unnamed protein product [Symbiodinium microadriaticum]|nr:unnamed protein product [Symbiodinium microadriaticum]CAE7824672.1 unnamed protein product [Symbiodinium sp. KB8]